ncbi:MAG TPA: hypothetical protein VM052_00220 [Candidatus Limnocylindrales bacterium]|nr:hypothetical protein [Candidatus Limnocylindrales bacterium]
MRLRALVTILCLALPFLPAVALIASADEDSRAAPTLPSPSIRPPLAILRHVDAPATAAPIAPPHAPSAIAPPHVPSATAPTDASGKELVVLVGGYQSCACPDDGTFDALRKRLATDPHLDVIRFGADPRFPYDSYGPIEPSAISLRDQVRAVAPEYAGVHIVTHSMGGVVADRAFGAGLSHDDGVVSYVSWSAPHSGSDAARALALTGAVTGRAGGALRESLLWFHMEADAPAVLDLARARPIAPPPGVVRLDLRMANDRLVTAHDGEDPGVPSRILAARGLDGHGGILSDPQAIEQTIRTIVDRRVPPDERSVLLRMAAQNESERVGGEMLAAICILSVFVCAASLVARTPLATQLTSALGALMPRGTRRPCP